MSYAALRILEHDSTTRPPSRSLRSWLIRSLRNAIVSKASADREAEWPSTAERQQCQDYLVRDQARLRSESPR